MAVRVGLIGCGRWGRHILRDLGSLGAQVHVVARSEASRSRATDGCAASGVAEVEALPPVDGVVVATATSSHADVIASVLPLGVPIFAEKPLCSDPAAAAALAAAAPDRLFVMDKWRYHPGVLRLAALASSGDLGEVVGVRTRRVGWGTGHDDVDAVWVLTSHDLSIGLEILGSLPEPRAAVAEPDGRGGLGALHGILGDRPWLTVEVSERAPRNERLVEVRGTLAVARLDGGWDEHVTVVPFGPGDPDPVTVPTPGELPLLAELRAFVGHLRGGPPPRSSASEAAMIVDRIAILRSLAGETGSG